jgi:ribonuclease HI
MHGSWGYVIRDEDSDIILAGAGKIWIMLWRRGKAELTACIHGVKAAMQCGMGRIIIETDAVLVQQYKDSNRQAIFYWGLST